MKITDLAIHRKVTTAMLAMILVVLGSLAFTRLGLDFFPDVEYPTVSVITIYAGASSEDIEKMITRRLEQIINTIRGIKKATSVTSESVSLIMVELDWGTNLDFAAQEIRDRIGLSRDALPQDATDPLVLKFNLAQFPIMIGGITANMPISELKNLIDDEVVPRLERIDGVASVQVYSMEIREIIVDIDQPSLESRNIPLHQILLSLRRENLNLPAGHLVERHKEFLVRAIGEFKSLDDIRNTLVGTTPFGHPIYVKDVAEVRDALQENQFITRIQGRQGLIYVINKRSRANTVTTARAVKKELDKTQKILPPDVRFFPRMDQSEIILRVLRETGYNAVAGGLLAVVLIIIFLRSWQPTIIIVLAIPLSVITTFIALYAAGYTINLLTLGGFALGIGMLVDNAVVVIENIFRHLEEGRDEVECARRGASEVGMAIAASTLTTIAVFFPMIFASGITGKMTRGLALSLTFSLLASLLVALTIVPLLASLLLKKKSLFRQEGGKYKSTQFLRIRNFYKKALHRALRWRGLVLAGAFSLTLLSLGLVRFLGTEFMPEMDHDWIILSVKLPVGTSLEETNRVMTLAEEVIASEPEVETISSQAGTQTDVSTLDTARGFSTTGSHEGLIWVSLAEQSRRSLSNTEILERIRQKLPRMKNAKYEFLNVNQDMMNGAEAPVVISVYGKDLGRLKTIADQVVDRIRDVEGLRDLTHTLAEGKPEYHIRVDREQAYRMGLTVSQIAGAIQTASLGTVVTRYRDEIDEVDIRVRFQKRFRDSLDSIKNIPVLSPLKQVVRLGQVATISRGEGPLRIMRENQARKISVLANIAGRDLGSVVRDIKKRLAGIDSRLSSGYVIEYGGQYQDMQETFVIMAGTFALATLLVYMIMASLFESFLHPLVIMFTIPLAFIGVVLALIVSGKSVSLTALIGFIILEGIAVNNGIVMVDYINQLKRKGVEKKEAILQACTVRLRPVLITALTTILGMIPMALSTSAGSEFRASMAITMVGGLTATTFLTLFVIPVIYSLFDRVKFS